LNEGVAHARGTYIARLDCGDRADAHRLQKQVGYMNTHPTCAVLGTGIHFFYGEQTINTLLFAQDSVAIRDELYHFINPIPHSTLMIRRDIMTALGGYRVIFTLSQDYDLYLRAIERYQFHSLQEPLTHLRFDPHSLSYASPKQLIYSIAALASALHRRDGHADVDTPEQWEQLFQDTRFFIERKRIAQTFAARTQGTLLKCALRGHRAYDACIAGARMVSTDPFFFLKSRDGILNDIVAEIDQLYPCAYHCKQFKNDQSFS
ncbi:MAG: glycosyltransferase, partial [Patescibacteria group bacterium]